MWRPIRKTTGLIVCVGLLDASLAEAKQKTPQVLDSYVRAEIATAEESAHKNHRAIHPHLEKLFKKAEAGKWDAVSNLWMQVNWACAVDENPKYDQRLGDEVAPDPAWCVAQELYNANALYESCGPAHLERYARTVLMPATNPTVMLASSDMARFGLPIYRQYLARTNVLIIAQNSLDKPNYLALIASRSGETLWTPSSETLSRSFQDWSNEVRMNKQVAMAMPPEARAAKMFFDHNKNRYDFLAESCWARMQWMVPHLVPHGLFMKLSLEPLPSLPDEIVAEDGRFWDTSEKDILNSNASASDPWLRTQYADCRSNIAEMYLCRNMTREAEAAYRQALRLNPTQANAAFNLSWHILAPAGKTEEAISILSKLAKESPSALVRDNAKKVIDRLSNQPSAIGAPNAPQPQR